jgi:hypothetical protein
LSKLASGFASAAETGDLSALKPPSHEHHGPSPAEGQGQDGGQGARVKEAYRKNGPPSGPPKAMQDAFSSAIALVDSLTSSSSASAAATSSASV